MRTRQGRTVTAAVVAVVAGLLVPGAGASAAVATPTVTRVAPAAGPVHGGTGVTLTGTGFVRGATVRFGGVAASSVRVLSATTISAVAPAARRPAVVDVRVGVADGAATRTSPAGTRDHYRYTDAPLLGALSPAAGPPAGGTAVTISGVNLAGVRAVTFGGTAARIVAPTGASTLVHVVAPAHAAGRVPVVATGTDGTSDTLTYTYRSSAVTGLSAQQQGADAVALAWTDPPDPGLEGVMVRRAGGPEPPAGVGDGELVARLPATATSTVDAGRTPGATYGYSVFALVDGAWSPPAPAVVVLRDWAATSLPVDEGGVGDAGLSAVQCVAPGSCLAVGQSTGVTVPPTGITHYRSPVASTLADGEWTTAVLPLPPGVTDGQLTQLSCADATHCTAIGPIGPADLREILVETLSDGAWSASAISFPTIGFYQADLELTSLVCPAATDCLAVGRYVYDSEQRTVATAYRLTGGVWQRTDLPLPAGVGPAAVPQLRDLACADATHCTASGSVADGDASASLPLVATLDGGTWTTRTLPAPPGWTYSRLGGVVCPSADRCVVAGDGNPTSSAERRVFSYAHGAGDTWTPSLAPPTPDGVTLELSSLTCPSPAVCRYVTAFPYAGAVLTYDRSGWSTSGPLPDAWPHPDATVSTSGLSCAGVDSCVAVGNQVPSQGGPTPIAEQLRAGSWTATSPPAQNPDGHLTRVSCAAPGACTAVGAFERADFTLGLFADTLVDGRWTREALPTTSSTQSSNLELTVSGVSCATAASCAVAGYSGFGFAGDGTPFVDVRADDGAWTLYPVPDRPADVSCPAVGRCVSVGTDETYPARPRPSVDTFAGGTWTEQVLPVPDGWDYTGLDAVDCADPAHCTAVGHYSGASAGYVAGAFVATDTGGAWTVQPFPPIPGAGSTQLQDVSCPTATDCTLAGRWVDGGVRHTFAVRQDGSSATVTTLPDPGDDRPPDTLTQPVALSCATATTCTAVDLVVPPGGRAVAVERDLVDGTWTVRALPTGDGVTSAALVDVSCTSPFACTAVGQGARGIALLPLVLTRG